MKTIAIRLKPGADLRRELRGICEERRIDAACVLACVGSLSKAAVRFADAPQAELLDGPYEIVSMEGTVSRHGCHFHVALSDAGGRVVGGHLKDGSRVHTTAEIVIGVLEEHVFERAPDAATGYDELVVRTAKASDGVATAAVESRDLSDVHEYNRHAWNRQVRDGNRWTLPVDAAEVERARGGKVDILLTPTKFVPAEWLGQLAGADVLCLASGGGQQGPLLAAAGANVTVLDASDAQLERDEQVAAREGLDLRTVRGDMRDLSAFADASFDLIVHPCSNAFVEEILPVWREAYRVLRDGGELLSGFTNPITYCFDWASVEAGQAQLRYELPYRTAEHLDQPFEARSVADGEPLEFSHTLDEQLGGQVAAGFAIVGFYTDKWGTGAFPDPYFDGFAATRARK